MRRWFVFSVIALVALGSLGGYSQNSETEGGDPSLSAREPERKQWLLADGRGEFLVGAPITLDLPDLSTDETEKPVVLEPMGEEGSLLDHGWVVVEAELHKGALRIQVAPLSAGTQTFPALKVKINELTVATTEELRFSVKNSDLPPDENSKDKKEQKIELLTPVSLAYPLWLKGVFFLLFLSLVGGLVWIFVRWRRGKGGAPVLERPRLAEHLEAFKNLEILERQKFWTTGDYKSHYFGLSEILKIYLGRRYQFDSQEKTTEELLKSLEDKSVNEERIDQVEGIFQVLDRVKFTDFTPHESEPQEMVERVRKLIRETQRRLQEVGILEEGKNAL